MKQFCRSGNWISTKTVKALALERAVTKEIGAKVMRAGQLLHPTSIESEAIEFMQYFVIFRFRDGSAKRWMGTNAMGRVVL
jgi:hypothetical protein